MCFGGRGVLGKPGWTQALQIPRSGLLYCTNPPPHPITRKRAAPFGLEVSS